MNQARVKSMAQRRAQFAWNCAQENKESEAAEKYRSHTLELPMLILNCGLLNALVFAYDKEKTDLGWQKLYIHLERWLDEIFELEARSNGKPDLICSLINDADNKGGQLTRSATREVLSLLIWLKRFV